MTEVATPERIHAARCKLALLLGALQGRAVLKNHAPLSFDHVLLSARVTAGGELLTLTWGELALCAGADEYGGPDRSNQTTPP